MRIRRRKHIALHRGPAPIPAGPPERWSIDFVHDALADGRPFRILTVVDQWSRSSPLLEVAPRMSGQTVGAALHRVRRGVLLDFIRPANPWKRVDGCLFV
jgi:putative transposase